MLAKFPIAIAAIVAVMFVLVLVPGFSNNRQGQQQQQGVTPAASPQEISLEYSRQHLTRTEAGSLAAASAELLTIENDGTVTYRKIGEQDDDGGERRFTLGEEEVKRLKGLILETGFMQIPKTQYQQKEGLDSFTKYTLKVRAGGESKTISWVDPDSYDGTVIPPIITNIGSQMDMIISKYT